LITGENGTGKELVARALHKQSGRAQRLFMNVDMGALSESLFESELFGHVKGAFTDAREDRAGRFEMANEGTLFLDEIGNLSHSMQAKLLTALQNRSVTRVGSNKAINIDIRLISATNKPLLDMVEHKTFREDLLYRINTIQIDLPPLRERKEDIQMLAGHFLKKFSEKYTKELSLSKEALNKLKGYHWPGNVRELQHTIEKAVILSEQSKLEEVDFSFTAAKKEIIGDSLNLEEVERAVIDKAIRKNHGNLSLVAKELGISRSTLYSKIEKYGL
jgi:transcriptional regulator with PAS, ATPase and Fis domain